MTVETTAGRTLLIRSAVIAGWWSAHALTACLLLQVVLGDFVQSAEQTNIYVFADMAAVMAYLKIPLHPVLALGLLFVALTAAFCMIALLWQYMLRPFSANKLDALVVASMAWALKRQVLSAWLFASLLPIGATWLMVKLSWGFSSIAVLLFFCYYCVPILVLRPRWLGSQSADHSWLPSSAALAAYVTLMLGTWGLAAAVEMSASSLILRAIGFVPDICLGWLAASALIAVRHLRELRPHIASRFQRQFIYLATIATIRLFTTIAIWLLPPLLLIGIYDIFIAPGVNELSAHLPSAMAALHRLISQATPIFAQYWFTVMLPVWITVSSLYVGRCLVLFDWQAQCESRHYDIA